MDRSRKEELVAYLGQFITPQRRERIEAVLASRTRYLTVVLEEVYQPHNASAVLRSCEGFGVQDVHIVEGRNPYRINPAIDLGASRWLTLFRYRELSTCAAALRTAGYRLLAATPRPGSRPLEEVEVEGRTAILFGTEKEGLSQAALDLADGWLKVPMVGFTESFNLSVCAALILRELSGRLRAGSQNWGLSEEEKLDLRLEWYRRSVRGAELLEARFLAGREG